MPAAADVGDDLVDRHPEHEVDVDQDRADVGSTCSKTARVRSPIGGILAHDRGGSGTWPYYTSHRSIPRSAPRSRASTSASQSTRRLGRRSHARWPTIWRWWFAIRR